MPCLDSPPDPIIVPPTLGGLVVLVVGPVTTFHREPRFFNTLLRRPVRVSRGRQGPRVSPLRRAQRRLDHPGHRVEHPHGPPRPGPGKSPRGSAPAPPRRPRRRASWPAGNVSARQRRMVAIVCAPTRFTAPALEDRLGHRAVQLRGEQLGRAARPSRSGSCRRSRGRAPSPRGARRRRQPQLADGLAQRDRQVQVDVDAHADHEMHERRLARRAASPQSAQVVQGEGGLPERVIRGVAGRVQAELRLEPVEVPLGEAPGQPLEEGPGRKAPASSASITATVMP